MGKMAQQKTDNQSSVPRTYAQVEREQTHELSSDLYTETIKQVCLHIHNGPLVEKKLSFAGDGGEHL